MYYWIQVEKATGIILNAVSSPNEGVIPKVSDPELEEVIAVSESDFNDRFNNIKNRYNYSTGLLEPENLYKFVLLTQPPYATGTLTLVFQQQDLSGQDVAVSAVVTATINGQEQEITVDDGSLEIELDCQDPATVNIKIEASRHEDTETEVEVTAGE